MKQQITDSQLMASLFAYATEGIILANRKGEIILVNPYGEKMFGYSKEELVGQKIEILIPKELKEKHVGHREQFHQNPVNRSMGVGRDLFAQRKDGSNFPVEISLSHYKASDEEFVIAFIIDITIRKQNEKILREQKDELERVSKEIKQLNIDLERKVEDRTMMLRETLAQLERSKDELSESLDKEKELSDLKTRFVSTVSHEFRTPLSTVLSSASLLSKYVTSEEQDKRDRHIVRIKESVKHLSGMLEDLLSLGKLEEGLIEAKPELFACEEFMSEFINEMQEIAKPGQKIKFSRSGTNQVVSDKRLLKNILNNLVSNAIKFSPEDAVIEISCSNENDLVTLSVADKGIGISKEDRQHLFERFFRARNAFNIEGTGLGLHIVSKYVELLHGTIDVQSDIDKGSTFIISIPSKL